ncbi:VOC family protein [Planosporangium thailandense]|uniref:VOC family protein n=1 Tax=Planosporangium thailandense TaxID=765197 RepID=A0ABX0YA37_9ACTN|nr:VOC family protein [Planosporangium thailandense]NJC74079.1 VOC family protein [Planosporangium thailandense]
MTEDQARQPGLVEWLATTIDCPDPDVMARFYTSLFGGRVTRQTADSAFVDTGQLLLVFRAVPDYRPPTWPSPEVPLHSHFECVVEDPHAAARQLLPLGASLARHQDPDDPNLVVVLDPAGHPLCLIRSSAARRY